ncbi:E3 ubiquitin/ISG15 ligase TRIM25-like [Pseudophryne corroboree]|uniref:E3 ubiquitin/ISG15 ligase TRIM25-like n=1 Tax=Pseudophryne corroboree TaxID=495146 RepID=UPI00308165B9
MASTDLREELACSICLDIYTDPVTLRCGHNFCRVCIEDFLITQGNSGVYTCPECREEFQDRPVLRKNTTLSNIADSFLFKPKQEDTGVSCIYWDSPVPAIKSSLQCETSMSDHPLKRHNEAAEHTLINPNPSMGNKQCSVHQKVMEFYCTEDAACGCVYCRLEEKHSGHQLWTLEEACLRKKRELRNLLEKLAKKRAETERSSESLQEHRKKVQEKAVDETARVTVVFEDIRRQLKDLEKRVLSEISRQEEQHLLLASDLMQQLEIKKDELSRKMRHIEELCNMTDPVTVLQDLDGGSLCDTEDRERGDKGFDIDDLNEEMISMTLQAGLSSIFANVKTAFHVQETSDIVFDVNTAGNNLVISGDLKTACWSHINQARPDAAERFEYYQVLSTRSFTSGQHYWEMETSDTGGWRIGMCYSSTQRKGGHSLFGNNNVSWCLRWCDNQLYAMHNSNVIQLIHKIPSHILRIYLDYEAGQLSFYELRDPTRLLHTFTTTFTEPLHAAFCVWTGWIRVQG